MAIHTYQCPNCKTVEDRVVGVIKDNLKCDSCGADLQKLSIFSPYVVTHRGKPMGFKWYPEELNAHKDQWNDFKVMEETGKIKECQKSDVSRSHKKLKEIGKKEGWL